MRQRIAINFKHGLFVVLCLALCECRTYYNECENSGSYPYWIEWTDGELISIIDDSLAAIAIYRHKKECVHDAGVSNAEESTSHRTGLFLVNYRTKQKPLLGDTLEDEYEILSHYNYYNTYGLRILNGYLFRDTSALVFDLKNSKFGFWKIGEKSITFNDHNKISDLAFAGDAGHWVNGSIIFKDIYHKDILDTENGQIKRFDLYGQSNWMPGYEWMQQSHFCNYSFLSYIDDKAVCIDYYATSSDTGYIFLFADGIPIDTIGLSGNVSLSGYMLGNYFSQGGRIRKIDTLNLKFEKDFSLWVDNNPLKFCKNSDKNPDDCVSYSGQDLINFKGEQP